jgi:hypothetical protein
MARAVPSRSRARQTAGKSAVPPRKIPQPHGGALLSGGKPGNKGGGRLKEYAEERAAQLAADPMVWDVQLARAKCGDIKPLMFATERAFGKPKETVQHEGEVTFKVVYDD